MPPQAPHGRSLVIVDDDLLSREYLALVATEAGFAVISFDSGDAALAHFASPSLSCPAVLLIDLHMPGTFGDQLALKLRDACGPQTLLLAMSASPDSLASMQHFDGTLLKPFFIEDLSSIVEAVRKSFAEPDPEPPSSSETPSPLNLKTYESLAHSMPRDQLTMLYNMCIDDAERRLESMRTASQAQDSASFLREAHAVKGGCGMVGATELASLAGLMEKNGVPTPHNALPFDRFLAAAARLRRILDAQ